MTYVFRKKKCHQLSHFLFCLYWPTTHEYFSWENAYKIPGLDIFYVLPECICPSNLVHIHMWVARSSLSSWPWSSFLLSDFTEFALHLQTPPTSTSSPFKQVSYLFLCMRPSVPKFLEEKGKIMMAVTKKINPPDKIP